MAAAPAPSHAGVRFPPPVLYAAGLLAGRLLHARWPLPITGPAAWPRVALALLCVAAWLALFLWSWAVFRRAHTTLIPNRPAAAFVTAGPYRFTRNPMYASLVALYLGVTLAMNSYWPALLLPLVVVALQRTVIAREERYLAGAFPAEYAAYRRRVRRWL
jgi:protein-S-isoprenylcysteine O-methyltransferase Ste14